MKLIFRVNQLEAGAALDAYGNAQKTVHLIASAVGPARRDVMKKVTVTNPETDEEEEQEQVARTEIDPGHPHTLQSQAVPSGQVVLNVNDGSKLSHLKVGQTFEIDFGGA